MMNSNGEEKKISFETKSMPLSLIYNEEEYSNLFPNKMEVYLHQWGRKRKKSNEV